MSLQSDNDLLSAELEWAKLAFTSSRQIMRELLKELRVKAKSPSEEEDCVAIAASRSSPKEKDVPEKENFARSQILLLKKNPILLQKPLTHLQPFVRSKHI